MGASCTKLVQTKRNYHIPTNPHVRILLEAAFADEAEKAKERGEKVIVYGRVDHQVQLSEDARAIRQKRQSINRSS